VRALGEVIVGGKAFKAGFFLMKLRSSFRHIGYSLVVSDIKGISLRLGNLSHLVLHFHFLELERSSSRLPLPLADPLPVYSQCLYLAIDNAESM